MAGLFKGLFGGGGGGYSPDSGLMRGMESQLGSTLMGPSQFGGTMGDLTGYVGTGKSMLGSGNIDTSKMSPEKIQQLVKAGYIQPQYGQKKSPEASFTYKPGESGYNMLGQNVEYKPFQAQEAKAYNPFTFEAPQLKNQVEPYYSGIENQAIEGAKQGYNTALQNTSSSFGRRGMGRSGALGTAAGNESVNMQKQISDINRNVGFQRAQDYNQLAQVQAGLETQRQQNQAAQNLSAAQFGEGQRQFGANFGEQQSQFGANLGMQNRQQGSNEMYRQAVTDAAQRAEKMGYFNMPQQQLMQLYAMMMQGANANKSQAGAGMTGLGNMMGGFGTLMGGF